MKKKRFEKKKYLLVLYYKRKAVSLGWMYEGKKWNVLEVEKNINIKNKYYYMTFTFEKFRNRGYYSILLKLVKTQKLIKKFYYSPNNYSSKDENSNFNLLKIIRK